MTKTSTIRLFACMMAIAMAGLLPKGASACGTFEMWLFQPGKDTLQVERILRNLDCVAYTYYRPDKHAEPIFNLILKAVHTKSGLSSAQKLFEKYECLPSMKERLEYSELLEAFGEERCTPEGFFEAKSEQLFIVSVSTARIRKGPSLEADIIDGAPRGCVVKRLAAKGNWLRVKTRWGNMGYVHTSCLQEYSVSER